MVVEPTSSAENASASSLHARLGLSDVRLLELYETMLLARTIDERQWSLNRQGRQALVLSCQGHEAAQVGSAAALRLGLDLVAPYYRDLGVALVLGATPREVFLEALSRAGAPWSGGRQMPAHYGDPRLRMLSSSSPVGTQISHATGAALAAQQRGSGEIVVGYFGDGASSEGDFHEALNFAAIHKLPVVFICENNGLAISVPAERQVPVPSVAARAASYDLPAEQVDGSDLLAVYAATATAAQRARAGNGPSLIDARVFRLMPHSSDDDDRRYRSDAEREQARQHDPLVRTRRYLESVGLLDEAAHRGLVERVGAQVEAAASEALATPFPDPASALTHLFSD